MFSSKILVFSLFESFDRFFAILLPLNYTNKGEIIDCKRPEGVNSTGHPLLGGLTIFCPSFKYLIIFSVIIIIWFLLIINDDEEPSYILSISLLLIIWTET